MAATATALRAPQIKSKKNASRVVTTEDDSYSRIPAQGELGPGWLDRASKERQLAFLRNRARRERRRMNAVERVATVMVRHADKHSGRVELTEESIRAKARVSRSSLFGAFRELEARRAMRPRERVAQNFARCTHTVGIPPLESFEACQRIRRAMKIKGGCVAHHGRNVSRWDCADVGALARAFALDDDELAERLAVRRELAAAARERDGRQANDYEGRRFRGEPVRRGAKGTNRTSPRHEAKRGKCTPFPASKVSETESIATLPPVSGLRGSEKADAALAPHVSLVGEPRPADDGGPAAERESLEGGSPPATRGRRVRPEMVAWFVRAWAAAKLPGTHGAPELGEIDKRALCARISEGATYEDLALAIERAKALRHRSRSVFVMLFSKPANFWELVHEARRSREAAPFVGVARGGEPAKSLVVVEATSQPERPRAHRGGMGRCEPRIPGLAVVVQPEPRPPVRGVWSPEEAAAAWRCQRELFEASCRDDAADLDATGDIVDVPIVRIAALLGEPGSSS